ncbi:MAG: trehalose-6-phosphate synthase [Sphingobium sp.]
MNRLIAVSNRVQPPAEEGSANQGGLAVALAAALRESNGIWFGWSGEETENFSGHIDFQRYRGVTTATIDLEAQDIDEYYNGYANRTLWPLFHDRIDLAEFQREFEGGYQRANSRFADTLRPLLQDDDLIWVHDYHLIPLGRELRDRGVGNRLGFFLHIPWPPTRLLLSLPHHRELVESLFFYDVVGFQTPDWLDSFLHYVQKKLGAQVHADGTVHYKGRSLRAIACPIGIDCAAFTEMAQGEEALSTCRRMLESANDRAMILGVDRLDYSKGLQDRFFGYQRFLSTYPDMQEKVFLLQIAPPSREDVQSYQEIRAQLDALSGHINGEFASVEWVPIRYVNKGYPRSQLAGMYRAARIGLVTPLRDGMNLVAKEYVAAQNPDDPGVLILSSFAGAAWQMQEALLVNPHSAEDVADAIARALAMPQEERIARWRVLADGVRREDVTWWLHRFVAALALPDAAGEEGSPPLATAD